MKMWGVNFLDVHTYVSLIILMANPSERLFVWFSAIAKHIVINILNECINVIIIPIVGIEHFVLKCPKKFSQAELFGDYPLYT